MLTVDKIKTFNFDGALHGLRNPLNSWNKADSVTINGETKIGPNDMNLAQRMIAAGTDESKFLRQIFITIDIDAPLYWWKEFDTYKVGTVANSCSTMHKITEKDFTLKDFSHEHLSPIMITHLINNIELLNIYRDLFINWNEIDDDIKIQLLEPDENGKFNRKNAWWQLIQSLPSSYNQKRTVTLNYQVARAMYFARRHHKLNEWHTFCNALEQLPYGKEFICYQKES